MKSLRQVWAAAQYPFRKTKVSEQTAKQSTIETASNRKKTPPAQQKTERAAFFYFLITATAHGTRPAKNAYRTSV